jgi:glutamate racemase
LALIGVFDSGVGGLSILDEALRQLPDHDYLYFADSANAPYGEKPPEWIAERSLAVCQSLADAGCQAIVVACNDVCLVVFVLQHIKEILAEATCSQVADLLSAVDQVTQVHDVADAP